MPDENLSSLQAQINRLNQEKQAIQQEFQQAQESETTPAYIRTEIIRLVPDALASLRHLVNHSDSDSLRAKLTMYILEVGMRDASEVDGTLQELITSLKPVTRSTTP